MSDFESILFISSLVLSGVFIFQWIRPFYKIWPSSRIAFARKYFVLLPLCSLVILILTVNVLASFDVVSSGVYKMFYVVLGFAWVYVAMILVSYFLGLSWKDDVFHINNKAAMPSIAGAYLAVTLIYAGANIGDGPGWWCVIVAGGLGLGAFFFLVIFIHKLTGVLETISIGRNKNAGIRMGMFMVACGIVLARASGGDWVSFEQTVSDFWVAWPLVPLAMVVIIVEWSFRSKRNSNSALSVLLGLIYIGVAITALLYLPGFPENPYYEHLMGGFA